MHSIDPRFKKIFDEMEEGHLQLHQRLNAWPERGTELETRLYEEVNKWESWVYSAMDAIGEVAECFDTQDSQKHRKFVQVSKYFKVIQEAPFCWQIINKPHGYAGDAELMGIIYRNGFEGKLPFGRFMNKLAIQTEACQAVRNRKNFLYDQIMDVLSRNGTETKILSVAAGPVEEIQDALKNYSGEKVSFLGLDHDMHTIRKTCQSFRDRRFRYALANAFHIMKGHRRIAYPRGAFHRYCDPRRDFKGWRKLLSLMLYELDHLQPHAFDLVYSAGLYDYIWTDPQHNDKGAVALTKHLFYLVKPGGSLIIGNFGPDNPRHLKTAMEYVYEWFLIYRTKQEMLDFARSIPEREIISMEILEEPLGINYFLKIDKKI
jgi:extracellular factor (EF) 3-hydroxypalmitic acid methyl ester biosynthesis protein